MIMNIIYNQHVLNRLEIHSLSFEIMVFCVVKINNYNFIIILCVSVCVCDV